MTRQHDQEGDGEHHDRVGQGALTLAFSSRLLEVRPRGGSDLVQMPPASPALTRFTKRESKAWVLAQGGREGRAALDVGPDRGHYLGEGRVLELLLEDGQTPHQGHARADHDREHLGEDGTSLELTRPMPRKGKTLDVRFSVME